MKDLDDELKAAVEESEASGAEAGGMVKTSDSGNTPEAGGKPQRNLGLLGALLVVGGGVLTLVMSSAGEASVYALDVDQFLAEKDKYEKRNVRVQGYLSKGSLLRRDEPCEYRFEIYDMCAVDQPKRQELSVRYAQCIVPDTFQDRPEVNVEVTAEGRLAPGGNHLEATHIMAKCPSKYEPEGEQAAATRPAKCDD